MEKILRIETSKKKYKRNCGIFPEERDDTRHFHLEARETVQSETSDRGKRENGVQIRILSSDWLLFFSKNVEYINDPLAQKPFPLLPFLFFFSRNYGLVKDHGDGGEGNFPETIEAMEIS